MTTSIERQRPASRPRFPRTATRLGLFLAALAGLMLLQPTAAFAWSFSLPEMDGYKAPVKYMETLVDLKLAMESKYEAVKDAVKTPCYRRWQPEPPVVRRPRPPVVVVDYPMPPPVIAKPDYPERGREHVDAVPEPTSGLLFAAGTLLVATRMRRR